MGLEKAVYFHTKPQVYAITEVNILKKSCCHWKSLGPGHASGYQLVFALPEVGTSSKKRKYIQLY